MKDDEREIFQDIIDRLYARFLAVVEKGRPSLSKKKIRQLADGRIYTADLAKDHGLIDEIGYLDDAIERAKEDAEITDAQVVTYMSKKSRHASKYVFSV